MQQSARVLSASEYEQTLSAGFGQFEWLTPDLSTSLVELEEAATTDPSGWRTKTLRGLLDLRFELLDYYATLEQLDATGVGWARASRHRLADILAELRELFRAVSHAAQWEDAELGAWTLAVCDRVRVETASRAAGGLR